MGIVTLCKSNSSNTFKATAEKKRTTSRVAMEWIKGEPAKASKAVGGTQEVKLNENGSEIELKPFSTQYNVGDNS